MDFIDALISADLVTSFTFLSPSSLLQDLVCDFSGISVVVSSHPVFMEKFVEAHFFAGLEHLGSKLLDEKLRRFRADCLLKDFDYVDTVAVLTLTQVQLVLL